MTTNQIKISQSRIFIKCLKLGNEELILQYNNNIYLQKQGLAMGITNSPDLANLYSWYFKRDINIMNNPKIPFYGHFTDNCFALVYANSEEEALANIHKVKFDDYRIEWNVSDHYQVFLDMMLYIDQFNELQHMSYHKNMFHQERIPCIPHPLDVKRGTFIGEMSHLATLSSTHSSYCTAIRSLAALYIVCGYLSDLINFWLKNNIQEQWEKHLNDTRPHNDGVLVLESEFNTAWNYFSATELGNIILGFWCD
jgi:hypothetical protein